jgi:hypothetical protein
MFQKISKLNRGVSENFTFSHPDYTVGFRITLNRRLLPAPVYTGKLNLGFQLGNQRAFAGLAAPAASPPVGNYTNKWVFTLPRR